MYNISKKINLICLSLPTKVVKPKNRDFVALLRLLLYSILIYFTLYIFVLFFFAFVFLQTLSNRITECKKLVKYVSLCKKNRNNAFESGRESWFRLLTGAHKIFLEAFILPGRQNPSESHDINNIFDNRSGTLAGRHFFDAFHNFAYAKITAGENASAHQLIV